MAIKVKHIFDRIFSFENLVEASKDAAEGKHYRNDVLEWEFGLYENIRKLREEIYSGKYRIEHYAIWFISEPKKRMITSVSFKHRVVQWAIYRILNPIFCRTYIEDSYGSIDEKGTQRAAFRVYRWFQYVSLKAERWYYLKMDVSKCFYRVDHEIMKNILRKHIKDSRLMKIMGTIIDSDAAPFGLPPFKNPEEVPKSERLYTVGMPIGSLMSHMLINVYLNELDQYVKRVLRVHFFARLVDDAIMIGRTKAEMVSLKNKIAAFLKERLHFDLNRKTCIRPVSDGADFVGYRIHPDHITIRKTTTIHVKRSLKKVREYYRDFEITFEKATETFRSYIGLLKGTDSDELTAKIYEDMVLTHAHDDPLPMAS